ncbi:MAG TPA: hypothetical protein VMY99_02585 [Nevskiaceae bacterium]|nr:hypothetical protein [Nevskiaceae bacterium]
MRADKTKHYVLIVDFLIDSPYVPRYIKAVHARIDTVQSVQPQ